MLASFSLMLISSAARAVMITGSFDPTGGRGNDIRSLLRPSSRRLRPHRELAVVASPRPPARRPRKASVPRRMTDRILRRADIHSQSAALNFGNER